MSEPLCTIPTRGFLLTGQLLKPLRLGVSNCLVFLVSFHHPMRCLFWGQGA